LLANLLGHSAAAMCVVMANRITGEFAADYKKSEQHLVQTGLDVMLNLS